MEENSGKLVEIPSQNGDKFEFGFVNIPALQAKELMNYCLFRIESSDMHWM
jgi:hypothetical protein